MLINQVPGGVPVNVLHDQGVPNTLSGMKLAPIHSVESTHLAVVWLVLALVVLAAVVVVVIARASS
jgi:hypothetical protein